MAKRLSALEIRACRVLFLANWRIHHIAQALGRSNGAVKMAVKGWYKRRDKKSEQLQLTPLRLPEIDQ